MSMNIPESPVAFKRIYGLGEARVRKIRNELARGTSTIKIAQFIQHEWKELQDVAEKSLVQQINRFRLAMAKMPVEQQVKLQVTPVRTDLKTLKGTEIQVLQKLVALAQLQESRLQFFYDKEADSGKHNPAVDKMVDAYKALLLDIQKSKFDLGIDAYSSQMTTTLRGKQTSVTLPDGTNVRQQIFEAVEAAQKVMDSRGIPQGVLVDVTDNQETEVESEPEQVESGS